uniref:Transmembrane protein 154 n=1 Tax=Xenopus tropicalis TaxID=8364 RepID=A0A6I8QKW5_XENTR
MSSEVSEHAETSLPTTRSEISFTEPPVTMTSTTVLFADYSVSAFTKTGNELNESADGTDLSRTLLFAFPIFILILLIPLIIFIVKHKRWKKAGKGKILYIPIFEEDTPSVMEIEMDELDKWMNSKKKNGSYCLFQAMLLAKFVYPLVHA